MSNKNLLLPNYYVQLSINYTIKNIYTASIAEWWCVCNTVLEFKIPGQSNLYSVANDLSPLQHLWCLGAM